MADIDRNDKVEQFFLQRAMETLDHRVLPGALITDPPWLDTQRGQGVPHHRQERRIPVQYDRFRRILPANRFTQLLRDPGAGGMESRVAPDKLASAVVDDIEDVEHVSAHIKYGLEVHRPDGVVVECCLPRWLCFARLLPFALWSGLDAVSLEDLSDAFLADRVTQFAAFEQAGDLGGAIARTFTGDADDRLDDMSRDRRSAAALASLYFVSVFAR